MMIEHCANNIRIGSVAETTVSNNSPVGQQNVIENEEQNPITTVPPQHTGKSKNKMLNSLFQSLFAWMKKQTQFADVFLFIYFVFMIPITTNNFKVQHNELQFMIEKNS